MQITLTSTRRGTIDGFATREYRQGETYTHLKDISDSTTRRFLQRGWAVVADDATAEFEANRDAALAAAEGNPGLTHFLNELSASAVRMSKERVVQNPATLLATGEL